MLGIGWDYYSVVGLDIPHVNYDVWTKMNFPELNMLNIYHLQNVINLDSMNFNL